MERERFQRVRVLEFFMGDSMESKSLRQVQI